MIDQAEELFTQNARGAPQIGAFFDAVARHCESASRVPPVIAYRKEFRWEFAPLAQRLGALSHDFVLREVSVHAVQEAMERPACMEHYGFSWEQGFAPARVVLAGGVGRSW